MKFHASALSALMASSGTSAFLPRKFTNKNYWTTFKYSQNTAGISVDKSYQPTNAGFSRLSLASDDTYFSEDPDPWMLHQVENFLLASDDVDLVLADDASLLLSADDESIKPVRKSRVQQIREIREKEIAEAEAKKQAAADELATTQQNLYARRQALEQEISAYEAEAAAKAKALATFEEEVERKRASLERVSTEAQTGFPVLDLVGAVGALSALAVGRSVLAQRDAVKKEREREEVERAAREASKLLDTKKAKAAVRFVGGLLCMSQVPSYANF